MVLIIPLVMGAVAGISAIAKSGDKGKENVVDAQNKFRYDLIREQQFNPMAPYGRLGRGKMFAAMARAWGYDKIFGEEFLNTVTDPKNYPGTPKVGGAEYQEPDDIKFRRQGSLFSDIMAGIGAGGSAYMKYGGGGGGEGGEGGGGEGYEGG